MIDYKTIISTTDSKVTLMQWLQALTEEFGDAKIKSVTFDVSTTRLSLTIQKEDGTAFTTTQVLYSLTAVEQSLINNLIKSVTASSDGVTFSKAVSFQGNESHNGSEIHNGYASFLGDENHAGSEMHKGTATFTDLRSDDLTATDGQELVSWDGTTTALKGKATRPTYNGGDLALKSDIGDVSMATFMSTLGIGRWAGQTMYERSWSGNGKIVDPLSSSYTNCDRYLDKATYLNIQTLNAIENVYLPDFRIDMPVSFNRAFSQTGFKNIVVGNLLSNPDGVNSMFSDNSELISITIAEGKTCNIGYTAGYVTGLFTRCTKLTTVGKFDMTNVKDGSIWGNGIFTDCSSLKTVQCIHWNWSFNISASTAFEEADLVEIIGNLDPVSTTQTLTMGATNLAKLTSDEILVATGKGWALA